MKIFCHFTAKIVVLLLAFSCSLPRLSADEKETKPATHEQTVRVSSRKLESSKRPVHPHSSVIEQVRTTRVNEHVQVRITGRGGLSCVPFRLEDPERVVLDCAGAYVQRQQAPMRVDLEPVRAVRVAQFKTDVARVVIDVGMRTAYTIRSDADAVTVVFESMLRQPSASEPTSAPARISPSPVKAEGEQLASTNDPLVPDILPLASYKGVPLAGLIRAEPLPVDRLASSSGASHQTSAVSSDPPRAKQEIRAGIEMLDATLPDQDYVIGPQDVLAINVWHEPELSQSVPVRPDGKISLPLIGDLEASGLTPRLLQAKLTRELNAYIRKPQVTVIVREVNSHKFYVLGQVDRPGVYPLASSMTVLQALAAAGGFRDFAKVSQIYLLRLMPDSSRKKIPFNFKAAVKGIWYRGLELQPEDILVVP